MAQAVSFGQITITDLTDIGTLSVYPTGNLPLSVIYNPDQNNFTPNWGNTNLVLTPVVYYGGRQLTPGTTSGLSVTWKRQVGSTAAVSLITGETVSSDGVLTVSSNMFDTSSTMLSYIVSATYVEPESGAQLTAEGKITFSLVKQAPSAKTCSISGDSIFKYDTSRTITGATSITLTATVNNVSVSGWQYKRGNGTWATYPNSSTSETLTVSHTDSTFVNEKCEIKLLTSDNTVYDVHTIVKLYDGVRGDSTVAAVLTNEDQMIPCDADGTPTATAFNDARTELKIYEGGVDVTSQWTIGLSHSGDVTYSASDATNRIVSVTGMTSDVASITFTASKSGQANLVKTFSLVKIKTGADGQTPTIYSLELTSYAVNKIYGNSSFTPSTVTVRAYSQTGNGSKTAYDGRFVITIGGAAPGAQPLYTSSQNESSHVITSTDMASCIGAGYMEIYLYEAGSTTRELDSQTLVITTDGMPGATGGTGPAGEPALNMVLGNQADVIPCNSNNQTSANLTITIPFNGYKGTSKVACTVATPPTLFGSTATVTQATATASGSIVYNITAGTSVPAASGVLSFTFTLEGETIPMEYRWTRSTASRNGENAILLQLYSPNGTVVGRDVASVTINATLLDGSIDSTSSVTSWKWAEYTGSYEDISGATSSSLTVTRSMVDGFISIRCTARYNSVDYVQYISIIDSEDPLQVTVLSSIGDQIVNGVGAGAFYVLCHQGEDEVDPLKSTRFLTSNPTGATTGDFYYNVNSTNKTVTLKKYNGSSWVDASQSEAAYSGTYEWSHMDKDGTTISATGLATTGKVIYIDGSFFDKKMISTVKVTIG